MNLTEILYLLEKSTIIPRCHLLSFENNLVVEC